MSTGDSQLADNNNQETPSLKEALVSGFNEIQERNNSENQNGAESDQGNDDEKLRQQEQQSLEQQGQDGGIRSDEGGDGEIDGGADDGHNGDEVHHADGSESDGQNEGQRLLLESVPEDLQNTYKYLKKEDREHLEEAGYDGETVNQFLSLVKKQNDAYQEKSLDVADLKKVIEPFKDTLAKAGITEAQKIQQYISWEQGILQNPKEGMIQLANSLGFNLEELINGKQSEGGAAPAGDDETFKDPATEQIGKLTARLDANDDRQQKEVLTNAQNSIDTFKNQKDSSGQLMHPHFDKLGPLMAQEIAKGKDLKEAYDSVLSGLDIPGVKGVSTKSQGQAKATRAKKSIKDKKHAGSGVKSTSVARSREAPGDMKDELTAGVKNILSRR